MARVPRQTQFAMKIMAYHRNPEELEKLCYRLITEGENLVAFTGSHQHFQTLVAEQKKQAALLVIDPALASPAAAFQITFSLSCQPKAFLC